MDSDDFFDQAGERPEIVAGRYRLPHPETGVEQSWTRATTHAELPEDSYALTRWMLRQLLVGLRRRPDLLRLIESWADEPGNADLDAVITTAHEVAGNDAKANMGTAVHGVLQQVDRAWPAPGLPADDEWLTRVLNSQPEWAHPHVRGYVAELARQGLRPLPTMTERRVISLALGVAGTLDNIYEEADGSLVLGDKKTGRLDYPERAYAIQLALYQSADYLLDPDGGPPIDLRSVGLRQEYAVLVHIDPDTGAGSTYRVDLRRGRLGANLAAEVREWRRERHLLLPYVPPARGIEHALDDGCDRGPGGRHLSVVPDAASSGLAGYEATEVGVQQPDSPPSEKSLLSQAELMRLTKAQVQQYGRDRGVTDLAHNKPKLMPIFAKAGILADSGTGTTYSTDRKSYASKDPAELPAGPASPGAEDPTDPRSAAFHRARMTEIAAAASVADLGRIHASVTRAGGDQAWTDAMTEAARVRTAELDAAAAVPVDTIEWRGTTRPVDEVIATVGSSQDMAQVWNLATLGGSVPEKWTAERNERAHARLAALEAAQTEPPSNPFGN